jgi:hypothetical protein
MTKADEALTAFRKWACVQFPTVQAEIQEGLFDGTSTAQAYRAGQAASAERIKVLEEANEGGGLLAWLAEHPELELSWGDFGDVSECLWRVHLRHGGVNDREWRLVDVGHTPTEALTNARALLQQGG